MNITPGLIYWITRLDSIRRFFDFLGFISFALLVVSVILTVLYLGLYVDSVTMERPKGKRLGNKKGLIFSWGLFFVIAIIASLNIFIPTSKEMAAILVVPAVANNEEVRKLPATVLDLANEWLEELKPKKGKAMGKGDE